MNHKQYRLEWIKQARAAGYTKLQAEVAFENYMGSGDCACDECSAWRMLYYSLNEEQRTAFWMWNGYANGGN